MGLFGFLKKKEKRIVELDDDRKCFEVGKWYQLIDPSRFVDRYDSDNEDHLSLLYAKPTEVISVEFKDCIRKSMKGIGFDIDDMSKVSSLTLRVWEFGPYCIAYRRLRDMNYELITDKKLIAKLECLVKKDARDRERAVKKEEAKSKAFKNKLNKKTMSLSC